jgi:hypothetical protein
VAALRIGVAVCALFALCGDRVADAQVAVGVEYDRDRFTYHFDNPSNIDTAALVPHFFEQTYDADNVWLVAAARYSAGLPFETAGGLTPTRSSAGTDYDTFFDPDGSVIVAGTTGPIAIHSWRIGQRVEISRTAHVAIDAGYRLRVDISDFGVGHKTIVRNGEVVAATDVNSPEHTSSQMHEFYAGIHVAGFEAQVSPMTIGRLLIQLPEKYPGQDLVYFAKGAAGLVAYSVTWWRLTMTVHALHTWSYASTASLNRSIIGVRAAIGL